MGVVSNERLKLYTSGAALVAEVLCSKVGDFEKDGLYADITGAAATTGWRVVLDLKQVLLVGSSGLGLLLTLRKQAEAAKGKIAVTGVSPEILMSMKITNIDRMLKIFPKIEDAIAFVS